MPSALATAAKIAEPILHSPCLIETVEYLQQRLAEEAARRDRFYEEMTPSEKVEFIEGEIFLHSPALAAHTEARAKISRLLDYFASIHRIGKVFDEKALCVFPRNDFEPDVVFFKTEKAKKVNGNTLKFPIPDLVVEVLSDSTMRHDRGVKFRDYEAHGVSEYWIVDSDAKVVEQYVLINGSFELVLKSGKGEIESSVVAGFSVAIAAFFDVEAHLDAIEQIMAARKKK